MPKTIIITGNHHTPAIELIRLLRLDRKTSWDIHYISQLTPQDTHLTNTIIPNHKIVFHHIISGKLHRYSFWKNIWEFPRLVIGFISSINLVHKIRPNLIVSFGGYVSVPIVFAGWLRRTPSIVHEQTLTNSLTTKISSLFCQKIALSYDNPNQLKLLPQHKTVVTGNLLRQEIYHTQSPSFKQLTKTITQRPLIYITGGNQGSSTINKTLIHILPQLSAYTIIHQTGNNDFLKLSRLTSRYKNYYPSPFINIDDIGWVLQNSHIIISRSGVNICQEITTFHLNAILIPLPYSQQQEQLLNAQWVQAQLPQTIIINQESLTPELILTHITTLSKLKKYTITHPRHSTNRLFLNLVYEII